MRYYDELPRSAQVAFRNAIGAARDDRPEARDAFACLGFTGLQLLQHFRIFAGRVLYALHCLDGDGPGVVARILFGTEQVNVILALAIDVFEETEHLNKGREDRIRGRMWAGTHTPADIDWLREQSIRFCDQLVLEADVLGGEEGSGREVSREIVRGRAPHTCHWTRATIQPGERHLSVTEKFEGKFITTQHSLLSVYLSSPGLAALLAPQPETEVAA